jgi:hypothetical protein
MCRLDCWHKMDERNQGGRVRVVNVSPRFPVSGKWADQVAPSILLTSNHPTCITTIKASYIFHLIVSSTSSNLHLPDPCTIRSFYLCTNRTFSHTPVRAYIVICTSIMYCQKCRTPLKLDSSLDHLNPSSFKILVGVYPGSCYVQSKTDQ